MLKLLRLLLLCAAFQVVIPGPGALDGQALKRKDDVVYLKDGRIIRGSIVEYLPNDSTFLMRLQDGTFARFNKAEVSMMKKVNAPDPIAASLAGPKNPTLSWLLSFAFPGGGQIYNGDVAKGVGIAVIGAAGAAVYFSASGCSFDDECNQRRLAGGAVFLVAWIGSQVEAPVRASARNRARASLSLEVQPHPLGLSLARLRF